MPGKKADKAGRQPDLNAQCKREVRMGSYPPQVSPKSSVGSRKRKKKRAGASKRAWQTKENTTGGPANNHKAPWPHVTNKGSERRDNDGQVVLIKRIAVLSVDHFTNC